MSLRNPFGICSFNVSLSRDIKTAVLHPEVKAENLNFNSYIYILYYQSIICLLISDTIANFPDI